MHVRWLYTQGSAGATAPGSGQRKICCAHVQHPYHCSCQDNQRVVASCLLARLCVLQVTFMNAQGLAEAGLDHGGLMKELLEQVVAAGTQPEYGLFATTEDTGLLYPNPTAEAIPQGLALLEFLGG